MNREIKFRGIAKLHNEFVFGCLITDQNEDHHIVIPNGGFEVKPETVGQYTGLKDKNGVEIYEGDLVQFEDGTIDYIVWDNDFQFHTKNNFDNSQCNFDETEAVVIGNIHENPELLESN